MENSNYHKPYEKTLPNYISQDILAMEEFYKVFGKDLGPVIIEDHREYILESGQRLANVHDKSRCGDQPCAIHGPSDHPLRNAPRSWITKMIFRTCAHGSTHPDYDSVVFRLNRDGSIYVGHECCNEKCCGIPEQVEIEA